jgi:hypothetical protein
MHVSPPGRRCSLAIRLPVVDTVEVPLANYYRAGDRHRLTVDATDGLNRAAEAGTRAAGRSITDTMIQRLYRNNARRPQINRIPRCGRDGSHRLGADSVYQALITMTNAVATRSARRVCRAICS